MEIEQNVEFRTFDDDGNEYINYPKTKIENLMDFPVVSDATSGQCLTNDGVDIQWADPPMGGYYTPSVNSDGDLSWTASKSEMPSIESSNIKGPQGESGTPGNNGISPTVSVTTISGGKQITIEDASGTKTVDIMDGENGRGIASITRTSGTGASGTTDTYTITYTDNTTSSFAVYNGADGTPGSQGEPGPKAVEISVTLSAGEWSDNSLTVSNENLLTTGYGYIVTPDPDSHDEYAACMVHAADITTDGQIKFTAGETPPNDLTVNILRIEVS